MCIKAQIMDLMFRSRGDMCLETHIMDLMFR